VRLHLDLHADARRSVLLVAGEGGGDRVRGGNVERGFSGLKFESSRERELDVGPGDPRELRGRGRGV